MANNQMTKLIKSIILTDDDEDDRDIFRSALHTTHADITLHTFDDGEALRQYICHDKTEMPQLIFLDINMPRLNGFECLTKLRAKYKPHELPVVMYTTSTQKADHEKALRLGANLYAHKPTDYHSLKILITKVLLIDWQDRQTTQDNFLM